MSNFLPKLPEQVYDVQATVKPIHKKTVIWTFLVPIIVSVAAIFAYCLFEYYDGQTLKVTEIGIEFMPSKPGAVGDVTCKMLGLASNTAGVEIKASGDVVLDDGRTVDMGMWGLSSDGNGFSGEGRTISFTFENLYFENYGACAAHMTASADTGSLCMTIAKMLKNTPVPASKASSGITHGCRPPTLGGTGDEVSLMFPVPGVTGATGGQSDPFTMVQQGVMMNRAGTYEGAGWLTQVASNKIDASFDCQKNFEDGYCKSGVFAAQVGSSLVLTCSHCPLFVLCSPATTRP